MTNGLLGALYVPEGEGQLLFSMEKAWEPDVTWSMKKIYLIFSRLFLS